MTPKPKFVGCGAPAAHIVFRGFTKRLFTCANCLSKYEGSGKPSEYATDVAGEKKREGVHYGPARTCGHEILE